MQSMNKELIKKELLKQVTRDKYDLPIFVCKNLKQELNEVLKKYLLTSNNNIKLKLKALETGDFLISISCLASNFILK